MPQVKDADPNALDVGELFAAGMAGPARPREVPSPGDVDKDAPFGRDDQGNVLAPYGWTKPQRKDEQPRPKLSAGGRKSAADMARLAEPGDVRPPDEPAAGSGSGDSSAGKSKLEARDYTDDLASTSEALWVGLSVASLLPLERTPIIGAIPLGKGRKVGQYLKGINDRVAAQAHIFNSNRGQLVAALNLAANNSARARRLVERLEVADATWVIMCGAMVMPFASQSMSLWGGTLAQDELPTVGELAAANKSTLDEWIGQFNAQLKAATEQASSAAETATQNGQVHQ